MSIYSTQIPNRRNLLNGLRTSEGRECGHENWRGPRGEPWRYSRGEGVSMLDRRQFLLGSAAVVGAGVVRSRADQSEWDPIPRNLIPAISDMAPNYWSTWAAQNYMYGDGGKDFDVRIVEGDAGAGMARNEINEQALFGNRGWAKVLYPQVRKDMYLLLGEGWDRKGPANLLLDEKKFPSFTGLPYERLRKLNDAIRAEGWRGLALSGHNMADKEYDDQLVS